MFFSTRGELSNGSPSSSSPALPCPALKLSPITIHGDNQACLIAWNQNKLYFFLKEEAKQGGIVLSWVPTAANAADMFTKPLPRINSSSSELPLNVCPGLATDIDTLTC